jgi:ABC-type dipeptide/oligopeptide/nickel transport system permease component
VRSLIRHAVRRLLWTIPTLVGVSLVSFLLLSFVPDPTDDPLIAAALTEDDLVRIRRERFLDLPRFLNLSPRDVRARADEAIRAIAEDSPDSARAREDLARLGGAALPHVLPRLDSLGPEPRARVAVALAPVAVRMRLAATGEAEDPTRAVALWTRFWDDRGIEFRTASVRSAVRRLGRYGSASRAAELVELDTFALDSVFEALVAPTDDASMDQARALADIASHVTGRDDRIAPGDDRESAAATVERWQSFWTVYRSDFVVLSGTGRAAAMVLETRYGKWALGAVTHGFGLSAHGEPILNELGRRAPVTLIILFSAMMLAYAVAIPLGVLTAASRGRKSDLVITSAVLGLYAIPTAVIAVFFVRSSGARGSMLAAIVVLALGLLAAPTRQLRSKLAWAISQDYFRAAIARGSGRMRAIIAHGIRNALLPVVTLAALEPPLALGGAFVVERAFDLHGLGEAMIRAVNERDTSWLMALSILAAGAAACFVILTDLAYVVVDPRLGRGVTGQKTG